MRPSHIERIGVEQRPTRAQQFNVTLGECIGQRNVAGGDGRAERFYRGNVAVLK